MNAALVVLALLAVALAGWAWAGRRRALQAAAALARALEQGRFVEPDPAAPAEVQALARSLNAAVRQLREAHAAQAEQVAALQRQAQEDAVSGLPLRRFFMAQLQQRLAEPGGPGVALLLLRVLQLEALNARVGHEGTDRLLAAIGQVLLTYVERVPGAFAARLNGSDFALCLPVAGLAQETAASLRATLGAAPALRSAGVEAAVGGVDGLQGQAGSAALAVADAALAQAEAALQDGRDGVQPAGPAGSAAIGGASVHADLASGERAWRERITAALAEGRTRLAEFRVVDRQGQLLHLECPLRVQLSHGGAFEAAERWLALARRSRLMPQVDLAAVRLALQACTADGLPRAVHAAPASLADAAFVGEVQRALAAAPQAAALLSVECVEGLRPAENGAALAAASAAWKPWGVRVGVEHAGAAPQQLTRLQGAGLVYVKVAARHLRGVAADDAVRGYAQSLVALIHNLGWQALAEGIDDTADLAALWALGFDGATGPAVGGPPAQMAA